MGELDFDVIPNTFPPSSGVFAQPYMARCGRVPGEHRRAAAYQRVHPYFAYHDNPWDIQLNYVTFQAGTMVRDGVNGKDYTSLFDAMVYAAYAALEKAGMPGMRVNVSKSGQPSAGGLR